MSRLRWMALCFALGSTCFLIGPFPGYAQLVGDSADAITFFVGSILFTAGGGLQSWLAWFERQILAEQVNDAVFVLGIKIDGRQHAEALQGQKGD